MREYNGIWWTINQKKVPGKLIITDENKIYLMTYSKFKDTNIISGFAEGEKITLVDIDLDRTDIYKTEIDRNKIEMNGKSKDLHLEYETYKYIVDIAIFGHTYERKGDIRLKNVSLYYTNLNNWVNSKVEMPEISANEDKFLIKLDKFDERIVKTDRFKISIRNPYKVQKREYEIHINNQVEFYIEDIANEYIRTIQGIVQCLQFFLILCTGDNINIESIYGTDFFDRNIQIIFGYGKSNYENRSIIKNIIMFEDIEANFNDILKNWIKVYEENELLFINFVKLQSEENWITSEYMNLVSAIESLHLMITNKEQTRDHFAEIVKNY